MTVPQQQSAAAPGRPHPERLGVLVLALHFPPVAAAGTHRTLQFVRHLAVRGHGIGVVTTGSLRGLARDDALSERVPREVAVVRTPHVDPYLLLHRLRGRGAGAPGNGNADGRIGGDAGGWRRAVDWMSRLLSVPDRYASWIPGAVLAGVPLARRIGADVIYATAPPFSALLAGTSLASVLGLPLVADLRDPWATNPFNSNPFASLRWLDARLEEGVVRRAARVVLNTELAEHGYRERYGALGSFTTITNGFDPELLARGAGAAPPPANGTVRLLHAGTIYGRRSPHGLLAALSRLRDGNRALFARLCIEQVGPVEDRAGLEAEARGLGVLDRLRFEAAVPHAEAFQRLGRAHGLLLLGVSGPQPEVQVPAKLFEYLAARRPILALSKARGAIAATLERAAAPHLRADPDDPAEIAGALERFLVGAPAGDGAALDLFRYDRLTERLERELSAVRAAAARPAAGGP